jgi:hypothetical protein
MMHCNNVSSSGEQLDDILFNEGILQMEIRKLQEAHCKRNIRYNTHVENAHRKAIFGVWEHFM